MINYKQGNVLTDLMLGHITTVAHGCNCAGGFGSGIAGQIGMLFPKVRDAYYELFEQGGATLGFFQPVKVGENKTIINCGTQQNFMPRGINHLDMAALEEILHKLVLLPESEIIGIPKIGAGLAGGDWNEIEGLVNKVFMQRDITVYILP